MLLRLPRTLLWQLGLALMAIQAAAVVIVGVFAVSRFREFATDQTTLELQRLTPLLAHRYQPLLPQTPDDEAAFDQLVKADAVRTSTRITVIALDGRVLADSQRDPKAMDNHLRRPEVEAAIRTAAGAGASIRHSASTDEHTTYFAMRVDGPEQLLAIVRTGLPLSKVIAETDRGVRLVLLAMGVSLAVTFTLIYLVSRRLSHTVGRLAEGAAQFAAGDLTHRIARPGSGELGTLADALNHMAAQLQQQIDLLRAQRSEQHAIHQSMSNGLIAIDLRQHVISLNRAAERLLNVRSDSARGRLLQEVVREPELNRYIDESIGAGGGRTAEVQLRSGGGTTARAEVTSEPLLDAHDQRVGLLIFLNDVTQLRRLEAIRSDFAANVSHELRTPITNIQGYVETLLEVDLDDREQARQFLQVIQRNAERLAAIIEDLLALARLEQPDTKATLDRIDAPAKKIIESAIAHHEMDITQKQMQIELDVPERLMIHVNPQLMEQAIGNLLSNAVKYSPATTRITVSASERPNHEVVISVRDEGPGISPEHLPRLFERFYRVDRARSRSLGGTGLGLAIVKHIALVHGGRVEVESQLQRGSTFRMILPAGI